MNIPRPREGRSHSEFGFVTFAERVGAMRAVEAKDKPTIEGAELAVRERVGARSVLVVPCAALRCFALLGALGLPVWALRGDELGSLLGLR